MKTLTLLDQYKISQLGVLFGRNKLTFVEYHLALYKIFEKDISENEF